MSRAMSVLGVVSSLRTLTLAVVHNVRRVRIDVTIISDIVVTLHIIHIII